MTPTGKRRAAGIAVIGTDTDVGKTVACAAILQRLASSGFARLAYWKPIATGARQGRDVDAVGRLLEGAPAEIDLLPESCLFEAPLSPHLAASLEGRAVDTLAVVRDFAEHLAAVPGRPLVVEGVGGLLVPLSEDGTLQPALLALLDLPCLLVARSTLGTINHTLLTLEAARGRGLRVAGVLLVGPPDAENRRAIERWGEVDVFGEIPPLAPLAAATLGDAARALDPADRIAGLLRQ